MSEKENKFFSMTLVITSILCICPMIYGIIMWNKLPESMPIHFDGNGEPDNWGPRWVTVYFLPVMMVVLNCVMHLSFYLKAKKNDEKFNSKFAGVLEWFVPIISLVVFFLVYSYSLGLILDIPRIVVLVISLMFIIMGNYFPKAENWMMNIKIKEENYTKVKRILGWSFVIAGLLGFVLSFFKFGLWAFIAIIAVLAIETIIISVKAA